MVITMSALAPSIRFDYARAAKPDVTGVPLRILSPMTATGPSAFVAWDCSAPLGASAPATTPALLAGHVRVRRGSALVLSPGPASSRILFVLAGRGVVEWISDGSAGSVNLGPWDALCLPCLSRLIITAEADHDLLLVSADDSPLLRHLGATAMTPMFPATCFRREEMLGDIQRYRDEPGADGKNRLGSILGNIATMDSKTVSTSMWALFNCLPAGKTQKPHRHQSVAIDVAVDGKPGCYTCMAPEVTAAGELIDPQRFDWIPGGAFLTPPGWWHSHHNETDADAFVFPIQDAGLHTWLRSLDIRFIG